MKKKKKNVSKTYINIYTLLNSRKMEPDSRLGIGLWADHRAEDGGLRMWL